MNFEQFSKIREIENDSELETIDKNIKIKCVLANRNFEEVVRMKFNDMTNFLKSVEAPDLTNLKENFEIKVGDDTFNLIQDLDDMNFYQYIDAQKYIENNDMLRFFIIFTFNKDSYRVTNKLIDEFERRYNIIKDLEHPEWLGYLNYIIKKKVGSTDLSAQLLNHQLRERVMTMREAYINQLIKDGEFYIQSIKSQKIKRNLIISFMETRLMGLIIFLLKRLKHETIIKLLYTILKNKIKKDEN